MLDSSSKSKGISVTFGNKTEAAVIHKLAKFLEFQLPEDTIGLILAEKVQEIITVSLSEVLPVPEMDESILGIYNWRSEMLWMIDLEALLGYDSYILKESNISEEKIELMTMVVEYKGKYLGLAVKNIRDIVAYDERILSTSVRELFSERLQEFMKGYFKEKNQKFVILLDLKAIFENRIFL